MIVPLHGVFAAVLLLVLVRNVLARRSAPATSRWWTRLPCVPLQGACLVVLVHDRVRFGEAAWLAQPWARGLFLITLAAAVLQNLATLRARGLRPTDVPMVLHNVLLFGLVFLAHQVLGGAVLGEDATAALRGHSLLQLLVGTPLAQTWTLSWQLPLLLRHAPPASLGAAALGLVPAAYAAFSVLVPLLFLGDARAVIATFEDEPRLAESAPAGAVDATVSGHGALRAGLRVGVFAHPATSARSAPQPPGDLEAWILPADHSGRNLPAPERPLVLEIGAPTHWNLRAPPPEERAPHFLAAAERLAGALRPALLLAGAEPDGESSLLVPVSWGPTDWLAFAREARRRVRAVSPQTRFAVRLAGTGPRSRELFDVLVGAGDAVDVLGPRLQPGGQGRGGAGITDNILDTWSAWRAETTAPPGFFVLGAGLSPLAFGHAAHARFLEGVLARAHAIPELEGVLVDGWRDRGHTCGIADEDGALRPAGARLVEILARR